MAIETTEIQVEVKPQRFDVVRDGQTLTVLTVPGMGRTILDSDDLRLQKLDPDDEHAILAAVDDAAAQFMAAYEVEISPLVEALKARMLPLALKKQPVDWS